MASRASTSGRVRGAGMPQTPPLLPSEWKAPLSSAAGGAESLESLESLEEPMETDGGPDGGDTEDTEDTKDTEEAGADAPEAPSCRKSEYGGFSIISPFGGFHSGGAPPGSGRFVNERSCGFIFYFLFPRPSGT